MVLGDLHPYFDHVAGANLRLKDHLRNIDSDLAVSTEIW